MIFSELMKDAETVPQTIEYKIQNGLLTLEDQEEVLALNDPWYAYLFARGIKRANIEKCQEVACKDPMSAYYFAMYIPGADVDKCQEAACKKPFYAHCFARNVPGADKEYCRKYYEGTP